MDEKLKILKMLEEHKITAEEAANLLEALNSKTTNVQTTEINNKKEKFKNFKGKLKILINSNKGEDIVNISIPLKLAYAFKNFIPENVSSKLNDEGINLKNLLDNLDEVLNSIDENEDLVNIKSGEDIVRIFIER